MTFISLELLEKRHAQSLVNILNSDKPLAAANKLDDSGQSIDSATFLQESIAWMKRKRGKTYAILLDDRPIGLISLSRAELPEQHGRVGYWLTSKHWRKGYGTAAFDEILKIAWAEGSKQIEANFSDDASIASMAIWKRQGAIFYQSKDGQHAVISL